jgi:uncharacterized protein (TIGR04255 family)
MQPSAEQTVLVLANAPIIEAVIDIDCDLPPDLDITALEPQARNVYGSQYPKLKTQFLQEHEIRTQGSGSHEFRVRRGVQALRFLHDDEKQIVQVRREGYSFNRLAPYSTLDDYLPEVERTWRLFLGLTAVIQVRAVRLRYINQIRLPAVDGKVDLDEYLCLGPRVADEEGLMLSGFLNQHSAVEVASGHEVNVVMTSQAREGDILPIILDIGASSSGPGEPDDWGEILQRIQSLRRLKNRIFANTLTERCINLFQA